jgi:hypothetical protein
VPSDKKQNKRQLQEFHERALEGARAGQARDEELRELHRGEEHELDERSHENVRIDAATEERKTEATVEWRRKDARNREAIELDKKRRADLTAAMEEKKRKDREYEDKQHAFFQSFRAAASAKAQAERKAYERDMELKAEILRLEKQAFADKQKASSDELFAKNTIEREALVKKDRIRNDARNTRDTLFTEESRAKLQFKDARLQTALKEIQKKRLENDADEQRQLRDLQAETVRKKTAAENTTRQKKHDIDLEFYRQKALIDDQRKHLLDAGDAKKKKR